LEKGITVIGSSRSTSKDFQGVIQLMKERSVQETLRRLLPDRRVPILNAADFSKAMEEAANHREWKKTLLEFQWQADNDS
jgi:ribitol-5-phosphate 2-dehydrogenase